MKRYDLEFVTGYSDAKKMNESPNGEWVKWEDVEPYVRALLKLQISLTDISATVDNIEWSNLSDIWWEIKSMGIEDE